MHKGDENMKQMITLFADSGKVLTDGTVFGTTISLAEDETAENYYEITEEEYEAIREEEEKNAQNRE